MNKYIIYTDGSYCSEDSFVHGGIVFINPANMQVNACSHVKSENRHLYSMNNVGGEVLAAYSAILSVISLHEEALSKGMKLEIEIHHDYEGISKWYTQEWRAKKPATQWYVRELQAMNKKYPGLTLKFVWVKGHSGEIGNETADKVSFWDEQYCKDFGVHIINMDSVLNRDPSIGAG